MKVLGPVIGLDRATVLGPCILGHPTSDGVEKPLVLGEGVVIHAYAVLYQGAVLGPRVAVGHHALIREGNEIEEDVSIGSSAMIEPRNRIGARTRVHSGSFLSWTTLGSDVFVGPGVTFTDDPHPPCPSYLQCVGGATVGDHVSIGAGAIIMPGIQIGERALVAAGAIVTRPVEPGDVVAGNPARVVGRRDELSCQTGHYPNAYAWDREESLPIRRR